MCAVLPRSLPYCSYSGSCECIAGHFACTYTDCGQDFYCITDTNSDAVTFAVASLNIPVGDGMNLDLINNVVPPAGMGGNVVGCGVVDMAGGVDNALPALGASLASVVNISAALGSLLGSTDSDAGAGGPLAMEITLSHMAPNQPANDSCVTASLVARFGGGLSASIDGRGTLSNNVASLWFDSALDFTVDSGSPTSSPLCAGGQCLAASLRFVLHGLRVRLVLDTAHEAILPGSIVAGFMFVADADPAYGTQNESGFTAAFDSFASQTGMLPSVRTDIASAVASARDMHMNSDGIRSLCSGESPTSTNRNAVSFAIGMTGSAM